MIYRLTACALGALAGLLIAVPTPASAGNCHVGVGRGVVYQQAYVQQYAAPAYAQNYSYSQVVPYAVPTVVLPDTFYRVDSALAYARIAEAAAEAAAGKVANQNSQQLLALFQDFLRQQAQLQVAPRIPPADRPPDVPDPPQKGQLPPVPQPPGKDHPAPPGKNTNQTPAMAVNEFFVHNCVACHKPNTKRLDLTGDSAKLTKAQLLDVYYRITAPDDDPDVMPPVKKDKPRPTRIEDVNAVHVLIKGAK